jgi:hypothetical protein
MPLLPEPLQRLTQAFERARQWSKDCFAIAFYFKSARSVSTELAKP